MIIPIRAMPNRAVGERLSYCISDPMLDRTKIVFSVVDDGSDAPSRSRHRQVCAELGLQYHYIESSDRPVNMARARNAGVKAARSKYIMFMDVDLFPYSGYYDDILRQIETQHLAEHPDDLIMTGVIYLTEVGSEQFLAADPKDRRAGFLKTNGNQCDGLIEKVSTGTSVTLMHRERYLELGGYDEAFEQWGYEDLDFNLRLIYHSGKFPLPEDFPKEIGHIADIDVYRGWKSIYRLYGDITFAEGIVLFHIWHEVDRGSAYARGYERNRQRFAKKMAALAKEERPQHCRIGRDDPLFDRYRGNAGPLGLNDRYRNSPLIVWAQPLKKIPFVGAVLLGVKRLLLGKSQ